MPTPFIHAMQPRNKPSTLDPGDPAVGFQVNTNPSDEGRKIELLLRSTPQDVPIAPPETTRNNNFPALIPLRLPASLLTNLTNESRLVIEFNEPEYSIGDGKQTAKEDLSPYSITVKKNRSADKESEEQHPLKVEPDKGTQWYQSSEKDPARFFVNKNELIRIGDTFNRYTVEASSVIDLKRIGNKTRKLLDDERKKRKEIVRLDDNEAIPHRHHEAAKKLKQSSESASALVVKKAATKATNARKRNATTKRKRKDPSIDSWMPDVDHLLSKAISKEDHSNIVRLHGLPLGVKPEHVSKFFHGLSPSLIFVLPSLSCHLEDWDAKHDFDGNGSNTNIVTRHPSDFRVFVKFQSAPVADAAIERAGESIGFDKDSTVCDRKEVTGAAIALSPVPKYTATYFQKHMAIHVRKGEPIMHTLKHVEKQLGSATDLVWTMAMKRLKLNSALIYYTTPRPKLERLEYLRKENSIPSSKPEYQRLVKLYNKLIDHHEQLELDASLLLTHTFDPSCLDDSAHRLTQSISNWLLDEISCNGRLLKEARHNSGF